MCKNMLKKNDCVVGAGESHRHPIENFFEQRKKGRKKKKTVLEERYPGGIVSENMPALMPRASPRAAHRSFASIEPNCIFRA